MVNLILAAMWFILGVWIMFYKKEITKLDYFCVWFVLVLSYFVS